MTPLRTTLTTLGLLTLLVALIANPQALRGQQGPVANETSESQDNPGPAAPIRVALLTYGDQQTAICFASAFLERYARETGQEIHRDFDAVALDSEELFDYPFVVLSGERPFEPSEEEKANLKAYIDRGGFVLASAGCSNQAWARGFVAMMSELYGDDALEPIQTDHLLFHTLFDINSIDTKRPVGLNPIYAYSVDERVRVLFSPLGLNDTANAGGGCCCCGGSEIRNAMLINANALAYALVQ